MNTEILKESYGTLSETINGLIKVGYDHDFNIHDECLVCNKDSSILSPNEFQIDKVYRFEGDSDPEYQSILYAISSLKYELKGILVNGYGISADEATSKLIEKLQTHHPTDSVDNSEIQATALRPEGSRILNDQLVEMNLNNFIDQIKNEITWKNSNRNSITIFKSETMRILVMGLRQNAEMKTHKASGVISVQVLEGKIEFNTEKQSVLMEKGQMIALEENISHSLIAWEDSFVLLTLVMK